jgi:membrane fusion protein, multidrug efflux system
VKSSNIIAAAIVVVVTLWMLSGILKGDEIKIETEAEPVHKLTRVQVQHYQAEPMQREIIVQGQSQAKREVVVKAQTNGQVKQVLADKGTAVRRGSAVLKLADDARPLQLEEARSLVAQRSLEYEAAKKLKSKNLQTERQVAEAMTLLNSAKTQLKNAELNMARQSLIAPFSGLIQARHAEVGDYLQLGDPAYTLITLNPLVLSGDVSENEVDRLKLGQSANVELSNGAKISGKLSYIAAMADSNTRTYAIEVEAENSDLKQRAGMSATIRIPLDTMPAHKISPALLSLNDAGVMGIKVVDNEGIVRFYTVELLKSDRDGLWLGGLPQSMDLIIVGQGFVREGDKVEIAREKEAS